MCKKGNVLRHNFGKGGGAKKNHLSCPRGTASLPSSFFRQKKHRCTSCICVSPRASEEAAIERRGREGEVEAFLRVVVLYALFSAAHPLPGPPAKPRARLGEETGENIGKSRLSCRRKHRESGKQWGGDPFLILAFVYKENGKRTSTFPLAHSY